MAHCHLVGQGMTREVLDTVGIKMDDCLGHFCSFFLYLEVEAIISYWIAAVVPKEKKAFSFFDSSEIIGR